MIDFLYTSLFLDHQLRRMEASLIWERPSKEANPPIVMTSTSFRGSSFWGGFNPELARRSQSKTIIIQKSRYLRHSQRSCSDSPVSTANRKAIRTNYDTVEADTWV